MMKRNETRGNADGFEMGGRSGLGIGKRLKMLREKADRTWIGIRYFTEKEDAGIDGILVTVGLCIIALLLCVVMKNSLSDFIKSIVTSMTKEASDILTGNRV